MNEPRAFAGCEAHFLEVPDGLWRRQNSCKLGHSVFLVPDPRSADELRWIGLRRRFGITTGPLIDDPIPDHTHRRIRPFRSEDTGPRDVGLARSHDTPLV